MKINDDGSIEQEARLAFFAFPGVESVRMESDANGVVFWIRGNNLSEEVIEGLVAAEIALHKKYPEYHPLIEISDRFGRDWQPDIEDGEPA